MSEQALLDVERYRVQPGQLIRLDDIDPADATTFDGRKRDGRALLPSLTERLQELQALLYAENKHKLLIVIQAIDTGGKDGTIRHVFTGVNPQGVEVVSFKAPTEKELSHDYLWRVHRHTPATGKIVIFNRSQYEDILAVRVRNVVPRAVWEKRYGHINDFERMLSDEGTTIVKFLLHISREEQAERLQSRLDEPHKRWKFDKGDLEDRALWLQYMAAFEDMLHKTSTDYAPWYVIPANRKWYRNLVVSQILINTLAGLDMAYPAPPDGLDEIVIE
ncbi:MAG: polyphosphate kinase 2 family protein [Litorilinea sp.]